MRVLTNHPGQAQSSTWNRLATRIRPEKGIVGDVICALKMLVRAPAYDCVVLGAGRSDAIYSLIAGVVPRRLPPLYRIDCLWYHPRSRVHRFFKNVHFRLENRSVRKYFVWASREVEAYADAYPVPIEKIEFLPFHHTLNDEEIDPRNGGYIFAGGDFARDYATFLRAVERLNIEVKIATTRPELFVGMRIPDNVDVRRYSHHDYLKAMGGCRINVVPLAGGKLHSGGQQTFLNSMALGKPTIVTDPAGGVDYIQDGYNGLLVEPGDPQALRSAISRVLGDPGLERSLGMNALDVGKRHSTERHFAMMVERIVSDLSAAVPHTAADVSNLSDR